MVRIVTESRSSMALSSCCRRRGRMSTGGGGCVRGWRLACATYVASSGLGAWRLFPNRWSLPRGLNLRPRAHRVVLIMPVGRGSTRPRVSSWLLPPGPTRSVASAWRGEWSLGKRPHRPERERTRRLDGRLVGFPGLWSTRTNMPPPIPRRAVSPPRTRCGRHP